MRRPAGVGGWVGLWTWCGARRVHGWHHPHQSSSNRVEASASYIGCIWSLFFVLTTGRQLWWERSKCEWMEQTEAGSG